MPLSYAFWQRLDRQKFPALRAHTHLNNSSPCCSGQGHRYLLSLPLSRHPLPRTPAHAGLNQVCGALRSAVKSPVPPLARVRSAGNEPNSQRVQRHGQDVSMPRIKHPPPPPHPALQPATASLPREQPARAVGWLSWLAGHCTRAHVIQAVALGASHVCGCGVRFPGLSVLEPTPCLPLAAHLPRPVHAQRPHSAPRARVRLAVDRPGAWPAQPHVCGEWNRRGRAPLPPSSSPLCRFPRPFCPSFF